MKGMPIAIVVILVTAMPLVAADKPCVGRIVIKGNTKTPDWFIHEMVGLKTGDRFQYPLLRLGERHLAQCGRFAVMAEKVIQPTVRTLKENDGGPVVDLIITVEELPRNAFVPAGFYAVRYRCVSYAYYYARNAESLLNAAAEFVQSEVIRLFQSIDGSMDASSRK